MNDLFAYSVIRYVGDPVRGEGANIGVAVVSPDGDARVKTDPSATLRLRRMWPQVNRRAVNTFIRDVEHRVAALHQMRLEEAGSGSPSGAADVLATLSELSVNEVQLSSPSYYRGDGIEEVSAALFKRFVRIPRRPQSKGRYLTRATLRDMIQGILAEWATSRNLTVESDAEIEGRFAPHKVDLVVRKNGEPDLILLALPLRSKEAPLIRDSLPAAVTDLRASLPQTRFWAVHPDAADSELSKTPASLDTDGTHRFLSTTEGLDTFSISKLRDRLDEHYSSAQAAPTAR